MAYSVQTDMEEQISQNELIQLTDDEDTGEVDTDVLSRAIADADAEIDSYCANRYTVPFSPVPAMIRKLSVDIAIYNLFSRRALDVSDERQQRYDNAIRFLRDLAKGLISLGAESPSPVNPDNSVSMDSNTRVFNRNKLRGF
ncbi:MAG: DUF1320 domain-containing protein [Pseudomonadota bacterium]